MLNKLYLSKLLFSSLLVCSSLYAGTTKCEDCHDSLTKNSAALHYTISKPNSPETKYWDDFLHSGTKDITVYIRDLSRKDAQAALWFITTGGKHGFAARQATSQERIYLEDAIKQVALSYSSGANSGRGLQEWSQVSTANHAGHLHLQMIYKQIDELKKDNVELKFKVSNLEKEIDFLKIAKKETDERLVKAEERVDDLNNKLNNIYDDLKTESTSRAADIEKLSQSIKDQVALNAKSFKEHNDQFLRSLPTVLKPIMDDMKKMADSSEKRLAGVLEKNRKEAMDREKQLREDAKESRDKYIELLLAKIERLEKREKGSLVTLFSPKVGEEENSEPFGSLSPDLMIH